MATEQISPVPFIAFFGGLAIYGYSNSLLVTATFVVALITGSIISVLRQPLPDTEQGD